MDTVVYALLNKKIRGLVSGIQSASINDTTITFTMNDGSTQTMTFPTPSDGVSIVDVEVNSDNTLTCELSDGSTITTKNKISGGSDTSEKFDRTDLTTIDVGGLNSGSSVKDKTSKEVLESILFPYQKPTLAFSISPSTIIYTVGTTVSSINFTINVTKKSNDIQSIKVYDGSILLTTITNNVASGGTFTYSYSCNITSNTTLKVEVNDGTSTVSATKNITFGYESYYGYIADGIIVDESAVQSLQNSVLKTSKALNYNGIACTNSKIVYAYPQNQGLLTSILDGNGFEYINSYECNTMTINSVSYYVYVMIDSTTLDGFTQKFA